MQPDHRHVCSFSYIPPRVYEVDIVVDAGECQMASLGHPARTIEFFGLLLSIFPSDCYASLSSCMPAGLSTMCTYATIATR